MAAQLDQAIDAATTNPIVRVAMRLAAQLESGARAEAVGDGGCSIGFYQINTCAHKDITPAEARDPLAATLYMLPRFEAAARKFAQSPLWGTTPMLAHAWVVFEAERPFGWPNDLFRAYSWERITAAWSTISRNLVGLPPAAGTPPAAGQGDPPFAGATEGMVDRSPDPLDMTIRRISLFGASLADPSDPNLWLRAALVAGGLACIVGGGWLAVGGAG